VQVHELYGAYANTPLAFRDKVIGGEQNPITLNKIYLMVKTMEDTIRPTVIKMNDLVSLAEASELLVPKGK
jgi:hypothetical protein